MSAFPAIGEASGLKNCFGDDHQNKTIQKCSFLAKCLRLGSKSTGKKTYRGHTWFCCCPKMPKHLSLKTQNFSAKRGYQNHLKISPICLILSEWTGMTGFLAEEIPLISFRAQTTNNGSREVWL